MNSIAADGLAVGNLFIATAGPATIRQITPDGIINTVGGSGATGYSSVGHSYSGDGGPATRPARSRIPPVSPQTWQHFCCRHLQQRCPWATPVKDRCLPMSDCLPQ
jgi:hypothetical protein